MAGLSIEALRRMPLFEDLEPAELQWIAEAMHVARVPAGGIVTAEGGSGDGFFVIESGEAEVRVGGEPRATLTAGDHFGEVALLQGSERTATVIARSELRCHALTPWDFRALVERQPSIAWQVLQSMVVRLAQR